MSTQAAPALEPTQSKEVPQLTDAYRKAHKSYVMSSGLLASWELIGITLTTKERWGIELKSPSAVPLILFTLVFYSGYKLTIEWLQCDPERRKNAAAKLDYVTAHVMALAAIAISVVQYLLRIQIVDALKHEQAIAVLVGLAFVYGYVILWYTRWWKRHRPWGIWRFAGVIFSFILQLAATPLFKNHEIYGLILFISGNAVLIFVLDVYKLIAQLFLLRVRQVRQLIKLGRPAHTKGPD